MQMTNTKRDISIDLIKVIAIMGVVIIHSCDFNSPIASQSWNFSLFWRTLMGASVPLFLMSSGAIMLDSAKDISLKKLYFKNILRILIAMIFWGMLYKIYHLHDVGELTHSSSLKGLYEVLVFNQEFHFYYIHMILIVYAFLPVTRTVVEHSSKKQLEYLLVLWAVFAIIYPTARLFYPFSEFSGMATMWGINLTYASIGYGILGYYLKKYPLTVFKSIICIILGFGSMFVLTLFMSLKYDVLYEHYLAGNTFCACVLAIGVFSLAKHITINSSKINASVSWVSKSSFCIYLVHMFVMYFLKDNNINISFAPGIISIPLYALMITVICMVVYFVLSKIPVVKKWLI